MSQTERRRRRINSISAAPTSGGTERPAAATDYDAAVSAFLRNCKIRNLTNETLKYYSDILSVLKAELAALGISRPIDIAPDHIYSAIEAKQNSGVSDATVNMYFRGWRAFFNFLADEGILTTSPMVGMKPIRAEKRVIETFSKEQIRRLLASPDRTTFTGYRDYVLMLLLLDTGIRISEAEGIRTMDIAWREREIKIYGKGRKERMVPFQSTVYKHLREYITIRGPLDHDYLFVNIDNDPWKTRSMQETISKYGDMANITNVRVSPHTFRHTFARLYIVNGGDIFSLQKILGHSTLEMVRNYVNLWGTDVSRKHAKYSPVERLDED